VKQNEKLNYLKAVNEILAGLKVEASQLACHLASRSAMLAWSDE
jgi:hypothetical protein